MNSTMNTIGHIAVNDPITCLLENNDTAMLKGFLDDTSPSLLAGYYCKVANSMNSLFASKTQIAQLMDIAESYEPVVDGAIHRLTHLYLNDTHISPVEHERISLACQLLFRIEMNAYGQVIRQCLASGETRPGMLATALHRKMMLHVFLHMVSHMMYTDIGSKQWLALNRLFQLAEQHGLADFSVPHHEACFKANITITDLYTYPLLMASASLHKLKVCDIVHAFYSVFEQSGSVSIDNLPEQNNNALTVDLSLGSAPHFRRFLTNHSGSVIRFLHIGKLLEKLSHQRTGSNEIFNRSNLSEELKRHLLKSWTKYYVREPRVPAHDQVLVAIGFRNIHYHLAGGRTLNEILGERAGLAIVYDDDALPQKTAERAMDIWSQTSFVQENKARCFKENHHLPFEQYPGYIPGTQSLHPVANGLLVDKSQHGSCVELPASFQHDISVGELVGIRVANSTDVSNTSQWTIGTVAWFRITEDHKMRIGIRLLCNQPVAVGIDVPLVYALKTSFTTGIVLKNDNCNNYVSSIILNESNLCENKSLKLLQDSASMDILLGRQLQTGTHYRHFHIYSCG